MINQQKKDFPIYYKNNDMLPKLDCQIKKII